MGQSADAGAPGESDVHSVAGTSRAEVGDGVAHPAPPVSEMSNDKHVLTAGSASGNECCSAGATGGK